MTPDRFSGVPKRLRLVYRWRAWRIYTAPNDGGSPGKGTYEGEGKGETSFRFKSLSEQVERRKKNGRISRQCCSLLARRSGRCSLLHPERQGAAYGPFETGQGSRHRD